MPEKPVWWRHEDWLAVWLGSFFLIAVLLGVRLVLPGFKWSDTGSLANLATPAVLGRLALVCVVYLLTSLPGIVALKGSASRYAIGFPVVFALAWLAQILAGNAKASYWGIEYVIFALVLGLFVSNVVGVPGWLAEAVRTEYYIKTGLVIMGATILFQEIMTAGALGMLQAIAVVIVVWYFSFWLAKRMRLDDEFAAILSSAVSICGVSAAIATCGAIQGDRRKLSYVASVVLIVAVPMIVIQPWIIRGLQLPDQVGGAWLGGTLDTTGSVVAAGALISETAMKIGTIVKFSQNVLIGFAAFFLSVWWTMRKPVEGQQRPTAGVIWERFPKFVLGFIVASLVFSLLIDTTTVSATKSLVAGLRTWWFALAFVSIGMETKFTDLLSMEGGRPLVVFLGAQFVNLLWTLLLAYLIFGGVLFAPPAM
ncbi:MAG TPA: putative sulfate exporter family transporter [Bryobacteraceae bacterium]|nr:putative sulfate exporter family transporter [Bryobacteraceae bacterium]